MLFQRFFWKPKLSPELQSLVRGNSEQVCQVLIETPIRFQDRVSTLIDSNDGEVRRELRTISSISAKIPVGLLEEIASSRYIKKVWNNSPVYGLQRRSWNKFYENETGKPIWEYGGKGVVVAVLDTGISPHRDLLFPENRLIGWKDFVGDQSRPYDDHGHGTYVAGVIAGNGLTSRGKIRGMAPEAKLVAVKVLSSDNTGELSDLIAGIEWCLDNYRELGIKIINLSLGTTAQSICWSDPLCRATAFPWKNGITVVAASGERVEGKYLNSPGISPMLLTVGTMEQNRQYQVHNPFLISRRKVGFDKSVISDVTAPSSKIPSLKVGGGYGLLEGSSVATAWVSGGTALILEKWPHLSPVQVKKILTNKMNDIGLEKYFKGSGVVSVQPDFRSQPVENMVQSSENNEKTIYTPEQSLWIKIFNFVKQLDIAEVQQIIKILSKKNEWLEMLKTIRQVFDFAEKLDLRNISEIIDLFSLNQAEKNKTKIHDILLKSLNYIDFSKVFEMISPMIKNNGSIQDLIEVLIKVAPSLFKPAKMDWDFVSKIVQGLVSPSY